KAPRTRSRLSATALSGRPTTEKVGCWALISWTSTSTRRASTPSNATVTTRATMTPLLPAEVAAGAALNYKDASTRIVNRRANRLFAQAPQGDLEVPQAVLAGDGRRLAGADGAGERLQLLFQRLVGPAHHPAGGVAAVGLLAEILGHLPGHQVG